MGLDAIEISMGWEQAFEIKLTDAEVEKICTPRMAIERLHNFYQLIHSRLNLDAGQHPPYNVGIY